MLPEATDVDGLALLTSRTRPHRAQRRGPRIPANILFNYKINLFESRLHGDDDDTELLRVLRTWAPLYIQFSWLS